MELYVFIIFVALCIAIAFGISFIIYAEEKLAGIHERLDELEDTIVTEEDLSDILVNENLVVDCLTQCLQNSKDK